MKILQLLSLALVLALCSCDPTGTKTFYIQNNSTSKVYWYRGSPATLEDSIAPGEKQTVFLSTGVGGGAPAPTGAGELTGYTNIVRIVNEDTAGLKKDFATLSTWTEHKEYKRVADYTLEVKDADF